MKNPNFMQGCVHHFKGYFTSEHTDAVETSGVSARNANFERTAAVDVSGVLATEIMRITSDLVSDLPQPSMGYWRVHQPLLAEAQDLPPHKDEAHPLAVNATISGERILYVGDVPYQQRAGDLTVICGLLTVKSGLVVGAELPEHSARVVSAGSFVNVSVTNPAIESGGRPA